MTGQRRKRAVGSGVGGPAGTTAAHPDGAAGYLVGSFSPISFIASSASTFPLASSTGW